MSIKPQVALRFGILSVLILVIAILLPVNTAIASEQNTSTSSYLHVFDNAGLLSTSEADRLEQLCIESGNEAGIEIILLTNREKLSTDPDIYIENFEDQLPVANRVYVLIDMDSREIRMQRYGSTKTYINSNRINRITDQMVPLVQDHNYYDAFALSIHKSTDYMKNKPENPLLNIWLHLGISLIIGGMIVGIMAYNSGGRMTAGATTYMDQSRSGLIGRQDIYLHTHITRVRKPQNNTNSGGGVSAGGRSHSSGGSRF